MEIVKSESVKRLTARFWLTGALVISGLLLIIYIAIGFIYWQQGAQQKGFEEQTAQLSAVLARPLSGGQELQAEYEKVNSALAPMTDSVAIAMLVSIAEKSGIDIAEGAGKFSIPQAKFSTKNVGGGNYKVLSFSNIDVQGDYDNVMAFISDLDSGETLKTMNLRTVSISQVEVEGEGEEGAKTETVATVGVDIYTKPQE